MNFTNKTAISTGAASGMGLLFAKRFIFSYKWDVSVISYRTPNKAEAEFCHCLHQKEAYLIEHR